MSGLDGRPRPFSVSYSFAWRPQSLTRPFARFQAMYTAQGVQQVNIPAATGDMGILANHVPTVEALKPGVVEVIESGGSSKKFFGESKGRAFRRWQSDSSAGGKLLTPL